MKRMEKFNEEYGCMVNTVVFNEADYRCITEQTQQKALNEEWIIPRDDYKKETIEYFFDGGYCLSLTLRIWADGHWITGTTDEYGFVERLWQETQHIVDIYLVEMFDPQDNDIPVLFDRKKASEMIAEALPKNNSEL